MNMHRLNTLDIPPSRPTPLAKPRMQRVGLFRNETDTGRGMQLVLVTFFVLLFVLWAAAQLVDFETRQAQPVRTQIIEVFALPPANIEEARIEGFRAGLATAYAEGCPATALTHPIAAGQ